MRRKPVFLRRLVGLLAAAFAPAAGAAETVVPRDAWVADEEMIVSASRVPQRRASVPGHTTVITAEELATTVSPSVADVLRFVPGLQVATQGGRGGRTELFLRGLDPNHVVVLIDGVRLNDPTNSRGGSFDPTTLALVEIDRIEVIRGPRSSVYGSDALAGVINIVSRRIPKDAEVRASARVRAGRFHMGQVVGQASGGLGNVAGLSLGAAFDSVRDQASDGGFDGGSLKARLDFEWGSRVDLSAFARLHSSQARSFPDSSGGSEYAVLRGLEDRSVREVLFGSVLGIGLGEPGAENARIELRASRASRREDVASPGVINPLNPFASVPRSRAGDEYERWELALSGDWRAPTREWFGVAWSTRLVAGAEGIWEDGESDTRLDLGAGLESRPFYDERRTVGVFAELEEGIGPYVVASGSLRYDMTPDEEDRLSPNVGLTVEIPDTGIALFGSYGHGFKRPSFYALRSPLIGNDALRLERSQGGEVGLRGRFWEGRVSGQLAYFSLEVENLIDFDDARFALVNQSRLISRGVEFEGSLRPVAWLETRVGLTFNPTDFGGTSAEPENRPRWRGFGELTLTPHEDWEVALRVLAVGSSKASAAGIGGRVVTLDGYERVDLRVGWSPLDWLAMFIEIENVADRRYQEAVGFKAPGIAPRVGLTVRH